MKYIVVRVRLDVCYNKAPFWSHISATASNVWLYHLPALFFFFFLFFSSYDMGGLLCGVIPSKWFSWTVCSFHTSDVLWLPGDSFFRVILRWTWSLNEELGLGCSSLFFVEGENDGIVWYFLANSYNTGEEDSGKPAVTTIFYPVVSVYYAVCPDSQTIEYIWYKW